MLDFVQSCLETDALRKSEMLRLAVNGKADVVLPPKNEGGCKVRTLWQVPGGPVVKTWHFHYSGLI